MAQIPFSIAWPHIDEPRKEEKIRALLDCGFTGVVAEAATQVDLGGDVALVLDLAAGDALGASALVDAFQVLVLTDLELCFWPPAPVSKADAEHALGLLNGCARRRALLAAREALRTQLDALVGAASSKDVKRSSKLAAVLAQVQAELDALCVTVRPKVLSDIPLQDSPAGVCIHPQLRAGQLDGGRGGGLLVATEGPALAAGEELIVVSQGALLNIFTALQSRSFGAVARHLLANGIHVETVTMLFAIVEKRRWLARKDTTKKAWTNLLLQAPELPDVPQLLAWPREAVEALGSEEVAGVVERLLISLWEVCRELSTQLKHLPAKLAAVIDGTVSFDDLLWAKCLFDSRAVAVEVAVPDSLVAANSTIEPPQDGWQWLLVQGPENLVQVPCPRRIPCLAPVVDLLNHCAVGACAAPTFDRHRRSLVVRTAAEVLPGCEVCLSYGALQNWELLLYYGFCPEPGENPHDRLTMSLQVGDEIDGAHVRRVIIQLQCIPTEHMLRPAGSTAHQAAGSGWAALGPLPPQLLRYLRILLAPDPSAVDADIAPWADGADTELDIQCLGALEDTFLGLLEPLEVSRISERGRILPLWWPLCGVDFPDVSTRTHPREPECGQSAT